MEVSKQKRDKDIQIRALSEKLNVDFGGWIFRWDLYEVGDGHGYEPSYPIKDVLDKLDLSEHDSVVDLGCGKGYAMYLLSKYKFGRIDGVEKSTPLYNIAKNNINVLYPNSDLMHVYNQDVREWKGYEYYNYFYLCNPFGQDTSEYVAQKIKESAENTKRRVTVVYQMGEFIEMFLLKGFKITFNTEKNCVLVYGDEYKN